MLKDIVAFVGSCDACQRFKTPTRSPHVPHVASTLPTRPWEIMSMDVLSGFPRTTSGNLKVLVINDMFTRFAQAYAMPDETSLSVAEALYQHVTLFGPPSTILTDQAQNFVSSIMHEFYKLFHITKIRTTAYHPQSNGVTERFNQTLINSIRMYVDQHSQDDWDQYLPTATSTYNNTIHPVTGFSPHELIFGRAAPITLNSTKGDRILSPFYMVWGNSLEQCLHT